MKKKLFIYRFVFLLGMFSFVGSSYGQNDSLVVTHKSVGMTFNMLPKISLFNKKKEEEVAPRTKSKLVALALGLTLGPFGVHRLYLGTKPMVPIAYTCTLGGGFFILPLIDIFYILANRNPEYIENNDNVFIWNKKRRLEKPPLE